MGNVQNTIWLSFLYAALKGLPLYNTEQSKWGQAHMWDRWVIFKVIYETEEVVKINWPSEDTFEIEVDYTKIRTVGKKALGAFLEKLQIYKSTANAEEGTAMFEEYSKVSEEFLK